jgi:hypothetical protein
MEDFPGKHENEQILAATHRHWMFFVPDTLFFILLALAPIGVLIGLSAIDAEPFTEPARNFVVVGLSIWYLTLCTWYFVRWLDYYLDLAIVTDRRVVDIDQYGLFRRNVAELDYDVIQDVTVSKYGVLPTLLNYGNVEIQTAGEQRNFAFKSIPRPEERANIITETREKSSSSDEEAAASMKEAAEGMKEAAEKIVENTGSPDHAENPVSDPKPASDTTKDQAPETPKNDWPDQVFADADAPKETPPPTDQSGDEPDRSGNPVLPREPEA